MKNNAKVGGILSIVAGAWGLLGALGMVLGGIMMLVFRGNEYADFYYMDYFMCAVMIVFGIIWGLLGALAIVGGTFGIKRRLWGLALAGAIASIITFWICGIPAVVFTAMGKPEFDGNVTPQTPPAPMEKIVG